MEINDYKSPRVDVIEVNVQNVLCQSGDTEKFILGDNRYDESEWE